MRHSPSEDETPGAFNQDLLLPLLVAEYKRKDDANVFKAMNQCRVYLVSALSFLKALGVDDQPVFGLVVSGARGALVMAWQDDEKYFIMERNVRHYDITDTMNAFQFATVLVRLAKHAQTLREIFETKHREGLLKMIKEPKLHRALWWSKSAQIMEQA
ncbi:hypothetical protein BU15DRAFT_49781 [Melanogaster broomeanus]|nr:hypothetical protein BU15DRAFT_49781 [Melanogaster broomeanus]